MFFSWSRRVLEGNMSHWSFCGAKKWVVRVSFLVALAPGELRTQHQASFNFVDLPKTNSGKMECGLRTDWGRSRGRSGLRSRGRSGECVWGESLLILLLRDLFHKTVYGGKRNCLVMVSIDVPLLTHLSKLFFHTRLSMFSFVFVFSLHWRHL